MPKPHPKVVQPSPPVLNTEGFVAETRIADRKLLRTWEAKLASWLKVNPDDLKSRGRLADIHLRLGHIDRALAEARQILKASPLDPYANGVIAYWLWQQKQFAAMLGPAEIATKGQPNSFVPWMIMGVAHTVASDARALAAFTRATQLAPNFGLAFVYFAENLERFGHLDAARFVNRRALELLPNNTTAWTTEASIQWRFGQIEAACDACRKVLALKPQARQAASSLMLYTVSGDCSDQHIHDTAVATVAALRAAGPPPRPVARPQRPTPPAPRRIGFLSGELRRHSVSFFLVPLVKALRARGYEVFLYSSSDKTDDITNIYQAEANCLRTVFALPAEEVAALIAQDRVDILIDTTGHTGGNRLDVFELQPAPVQATYLGYPGTLGVPEVPFRISDGAADPPGEADRWSSETLIRLPRGFHTYDPLAPLPPIQPRPHRPVTVGSFNAPHKYSDRLIRCWGRIAAAAPDLRFLIKFYQANDDSYQRLFLRKLGEVGIDQERLVIEKLKPSWQDHMDTYNRIDLGLDTFPYNGTTTTCEALAMGVPVVTLRGERHAARVGASLLGNLGMTDLIAETEDAYVDLAVGLVRDTDRLAALRGGLRERFFASPVCDAARFGADFAAALTRMWQAAGLANAEQAAAPSVAAVPQPAAEPLRASPAASARLGATGKPIVRVLHNLARSGGTVISKCLGAMPGVYLLSEVHPHAEHVAAAYRPMTAKLDPRYQAWTWYRLAAGTLQLADTSPSERFVEIVGAIEVELAERGGTLLIRDWSHLDFTAAPFLDSATFTLTTADVLATRFDVVQTTTVRHPIDQWCSLHRLTVMQDLSLDTYLHGYLAFAERCAAIGFVRYEDFTAAPDAHLKTLCDRLQIPFDPGYAATWADNAHVTGDDSPLKTIAPVRRKPVDADLLAAFRANGDYRSAIALLGYPD
ncbi:MAG: sulfotransferase [Rhodospirillaceae bacterium]|nr:sulfotransferase [Rhodospirillaceae bacterium]